MKMLNKDKILLKSLISKYGAHGVEGAINKLNEDSNNILKYIKCLEYNDNPKPIKDVDIEKVKHFLMNRYNVSTWEEFTDNAIKFGDCKKIAKAVYCKFKDMFDYVVEIDLIYDRDACLKCKKLGDKFFNKMPESSWVGNHFVVVRDGIIYDFSKGANSVMGVYLLDKPGSKSKYKITWSENEYNKIKFDGVYYRKWW